MSATPEFCVTLFWRDQLPVALQDRDWAVSAFDCRRTSQEIRVIAVALIAIDDRLSKIIASLNGMASPW